MNNARANRSIFQVLFLGAILILPVALQAMTPPSENLAFRQSSSTLDSNPGYQAFDGIYGTAWQLASGSTGGWVEQSFTSPRQLAWKFNSLPGVEINGCLFRGHGLSGR